MERAGFFLRRRVDGDDRTALSFEPVRAVAIDEFLFAPVIGGLWTHKDVVTDVFDFEDLLDAHELLAIKSLNEQRAQEAAEREAAARGHGA